MRYLRDSFNFDFGDDDSGIWWDATVTVDTDYDSVYSYEVGSVRIGGKIVKFRNVDSDLAQRITKRMESVETAEFLP